MLLGYKKQVNEMKKANNTRIIIASTLNELLKEKSIGEVSVVEICRKSNISRTTFYKYFKDIYDIHEWLWKYYLADYMTNIYVKYGWYDGLVNFLSVMAEHKELFQNTEKGTTPFLEQGYAKMIKIVNDKLYQKGIYLTNEDKIILKYCIYMQASATSKWIKEKMKDTPQAVATAMVYALPSFIPKK